MADASAHAYLISGLSVLSDLALEGAIPRAGSTSQAGEPDVTVVLGPVPESIGGICITDPENGLETEAAGNDCVLRIPRTGRFLVSSGRRIVAELADGIDAYDAAPYVLGSALAILLHQRGLLVLHGAAVAREGRALIVCGHSGAGKSTLAAALCRAGCTFISDDIAVVDTGHDAGPLVQPDGRKLKLWQRSIDALDLASVRGRTVSAGFDKFYVSPSRAITSATPLTAIYILEETEDESTAGITRLSLPDAMRALDEQGYRPLIRDQLGGVGCGVTHAARVLGHGGVYAFSRTRDLRRLDASSATLLDHWRTLKR